MLEVRIWGAGLLSALDWPHCDSARHLSSLSEWQVLAYAASAWTGISGDPF